MIFNSIRTNITIGFAIAFLLFLAAFLPFLQFEKDAVTKDVQTLHQTLAKHIHQNRLRPNEVEEYVTAFNFSKVLNHREVLGSEKIVFASRGSESFKYKDEYYFHLVSPRIRMLFKDLNEYETNYYPFIAFFVVLSLLLFIYIWIMKALKPLKDLKESISKFSQGDLSITCKTQGKDEIAQVANEFDNAARKIELLLNSRQLFLRTIMHELKTPIAKGRIVSELVSDEKQKNRMITVFERLDFLINDFAKVEQVISKNYELYKHNYYLEEIINNSKSMLMIDNIDEKINTKIEKNKKISVDYELVSMVFKNLIDNAFRYSNDGKVEILQEDEKISFISSGQKLEKPFEEYFTPFHNTTKSKNHGMGLGLYIVKSILDLHDMKFEYEYEDGKNIFIIII